MKLAIITTHPIQYNAPLFELLTKRANISVKVFYTWGITVLESKYDPGFNKVISWDIPLLEGYEYEFLENTAGDKGSHHFNGIVNPHIIERINSYSPDAVLVYGWAYNSHLKVLRYYKKRIPVLFRGDSTLLDKSGWINKIKRNVFLRWIYRYVDYAFYVGSNNYKYYRKVGLRNTQLIFAPHAVDNKRFACIDESCLQHALAYRQRLSIPKDAFVFLFAAKLEGKKDPGILLKAFIAARLQNSAHLVIAGNGNMSEFLQSEYKDISSVHFMDFQNQSQMPALYRMADVFVLPSKGPGETWGLAINEAMSNGRPVIVSDICGGAVDLVKPGENGFIFRAGDEIDLSTKMRLIVDQKERLPSMGETSLKHIANFTFEKVAQAIETTVASFK